MDLNSEKIKIWHFVGPKINCFSISFEWFGVKKIFQNKHVDFSQKVATVIYFTIFSILKHCAYGRRYIAVYIIDSYNLWCLVWKTNASGSVFSKKLITSWFGCIYSGKFGRLSHSFAWWMDIFQSLKLYKCQIESKKY